MFVAVAEIEKCGGLRIDHENHVPTLSAVTTRGATTGHSGFSPERLGSGTTCTRRAARTGTSTTFAARRR